MMFLVGLMSVGTCGAIDITWIGGASGNLADKANWDPAWIPSDNSYSLIAVFTNSATVSLNTSDGLWCLGGFAVQGNSTVKIQGISGKNNRIQVSTASDDFVVNVETGSSLTHVKGASSDQASFYAQGKPLMKLGGGAFKPGARFGWSGVNPMSTLRVEEGTVDASGSAIRCTGEIKVCSGATLKCGSSGIVVMSGETLSFPSYVNVEAGGTFDCGNADQTLLGLEGAGVVVNGTGLTLTMYHSGKRFNGTIQTSKLMIDNASYTAPGANWTVGAADTLKGVETWTFGNDASVPMEVRFAAGIGTFFVGGPSYPTDRAFYDLDGMPVLLDYSHAVWYVDDDNYGKAGMDGKTPGTAFGTLQEAMENPSLANYDTVFALPGTYDKGDMSFGAEATTNRVVVPARVRLASTDGPEKTVIVGQKAVVEVKGKQGNGPGAIRCVKLYANASISGFTLTDGHVSETEDGTSEDYVGGGVQCSGGGYVIDCIVTNNAAVRGGAGNNCVFVRCRVFDNRATSYYGSAFYGATDLYGCVIDRNPCSTKYAYYSTESGVTIKNCTFGPNESCDFRTTKTTMVCNTIFMSGIHSSTVGVCSNCVFLCQPGDNMQLDDCVVKSDLTTVEEKLAYAGLDADLHPVKGSRLIDAGKNAYFAQTSSAIKQGCGATDACGAPRVSNGTIDIGGYEYDWRTDYADSLGSAKKIPIVSATSSVVTNGTGGIVLGTRDVVRARCVKATGDYTVSVQVTGEGTLTVELGADDVRTVTAADGPTELKFSVATVPQDLRFEFAGSGSANLVAFDYPRTGMVLQLR